MARPKKHSPEADARARLVRAYVDLLEGTSKAVTVSHIANAARCNRDTFYYYFAGIDDISRAAMEALMPKEVAGALITYLLGDSPRVGLNAEQARRARHAYALISRRTHLKPYAKERLKALWLDGLGMSSDRLSVQDSLLLDFASSGTVEALCGNERSDDPLPIIECMESIADFLKVPVESKYILSSSN